MIEEIEVPVKPKPQTEEVDVWTKYEQRKAQLPSGLSAREYHDAIQRIVEDLGI